MDISGRIYITIALLFLFASTLVRSHFGPIIGIGFYAVIVGYLFLIKHIKENDQTYNKQQVLFLLDVLFNVLLAIFSIATGVDIYIVIVYGILIFGMFYDLSFVDYSSYYKIDYVKRRKYRIVSILIFVFFFFWMMVFAGSIVESLIALGLYVYFRTTRNCYLTEDRKSKSGTEWDSVLYSDEKDI